MNGFSGDDLGLATAAGFGLTDMTKRSVFERYNIAREWLVPLPLVYGILVLIIKYLADGKSIVDAILNGFLGGIIASVLYQGYVAQPKEQVRLETEQKYEAKLKQVEEEVEEKIEQEKQ